MIENKPSIYNAQSVYNQGGGGPVVEKIYTTQVMPDGKTWMRDALDFLPSEIKFNPDISQAAGSGNIGPAAWYPELDDGSVWGWNGRKGGLLYNWYAMKFLNDNRAQLFPGWHVPSKAEWNALATSLGATWNGNYYTGYTNKLKSLDEDWFSGWNGTQEYCNIKPVGRITPSTGGGGSYGGLGTISDCWSTKTYSTQYMWTTPFDQSNNESGTGRTSFYDYCKSFTACSIMLVKD